MKLKDEIELIENQTKQIHQSNIELKRIMGNFAKEVDDYLAKE